MVENQTLISLRDQVTSCSEDADIQMAVACGLAATDKVLEIVRASRFMGVFDGHVSIEDTRTGEDLLLEKDFAGKLTTEIRPA